MPHLSKSDFKVAMDCATKLYYKKNRYPSLMQNNEYLEMLADGGYMIGKMAQLLYDGGILIEGNTEECISKTEELLQLENVILFEPAISINNKLIRIDILIKNGNHFELIEVKSKSIDGEQYFLKGDAIFNRDWKPYIEDVAYQTYVLKEKFPNSKIDSFLMLPDKSKTTNIEGLINWFKLVNVNQTDTFRSVDVEFTGDLARLKEGHILSVYNVNSLVQENMANVIQNAEVFVQSILNNERIHTPISITCKNCEYCITNENNPLSGFETCWGELAKATDEQGNTIPHILELGQLGNINRGRGITNCMNDLIAQNRVAIRDIPQEYFFNDDGTPRYNSRPLYQATLEDEFLLPSFINDIADIQYPLFFIDFETSQMAIPYHVNMHPYEKVLFQWSCHVVKSENAEPEHYEWINTELKYPNFEFLRSLKSLIGYRGTVLTWSPYENSQFKMMLEILDNIEDVDQELLDWLNHITLRFEGDDSMILDMNKLAMKHYFHPIMGGRTSIKVTLPAVLESTNSDRIHNWLVQENLYKIDECGVIINPYNLLPKVDIIEKAEYVKDGSGAMRAYQDMLYGSKSNEPETKEAYKQSLLKYCKLDTLAMVIIWEHWKDLNN